MNELVLVIPIGVGTLITAIVGIFKFFGKIPEDAGGKVSLYFNLVIGVGLFILSNYYGVELEDASLQPLWQIFGLVGVLILSYLTSFGVQRVSKAAKLYEPRDNR